MRPSEGPEQITIGVAMTVFGCGPYLADAMVSVQPQSDRDCGCAVIYDPSNTTTRSGAS